VSLAIIGVSRQEVREWGGFAVGVARELFFSRNTTDKCAFHAQELLF
jgi:hypothetical protein